MSHGNKKIGRDTLIFNITSAVECKSRELGLCQVPNRCYALKAEKQYHHVVPQFRARQTKMWDSKSVDDLVKGLKTEIAKHPRVPIKYIRFSEAGDFRTQKDINKLFEIANQIKDIVFYGYTARSDLDFSERPKNVIINGSNFLVDNQFTAVPKDSITDTDIVCGGNCRVCDLCKQKLGINIKAVYH